MTDKTTPTRDDAVREACARYHDEKALKWRREAKKHKRPGGKFSECEQRDLMRAERHEQDAAALRALPLPQLQAATDAEIDALFSKVYAHCVIKYDPEAGKRVLREALASAPAPASGGVDVEALTYRVANAKLGEGPAVRCEGPTDFEKDQARAWVKRVLRAQASLSPAATPVSEAVWRSIISDMLAALYRYGHEIGDGDIPAAHRNLIERAERALAKPEGPPLFKSNGDGWELVEPASSPAGGDVREALERLERACDGLAATRSAETYLAMIDNDKAVDALLELDEARQEARAILALSQSTSAGRVE